MPKTKAAHGNVARSTAKRKPQPLTLPVMTLACEHSATDLCRHCEPNPRKRMELRRWYDALTPMDKEQVWANRMAETLPTTRSSRNAPHPYHANLDRPGPYCICGKRKDDPIHRITGSSPPCYRCGHHRDANIHLPQYGYQGYHKYVDGEKTAFLIPAEIFADTLDSVARDLGLYAIALRRRGEEAEWPRDCSTYALEAQAAVHRLLVKDGELAGGPSDDDPEEN
jgi:hypothetical protein